MQESRLWLLSLDPGRLHEVEVERVIASEKTTQHGTKAGPSLGRGFMLTRVHGLRNVLQRVGVGSVARHRHPSVPGPCLAGRQLKDSISEAGTRIPEAELANPKP